MASSSRHIGVRINDYRTDVRSGLSLAAKQSFGAVELGVDGDEVVPANLTDSGRRQLARLVANTGMAFAALAQESYGRRLVDPAHVDEGVSRAVQVLRLAADMRVPVVSHEIGALTGLSDEQRECALDAIRTLAEEAERVGTIFAIRSSLADPADLGTLVRTVSCPLVRISLDPAAMLMGGYDPASAVAMLGDQVSLAYVRDAVRGAPHHAGRETALGEGSLDLSTYLAMLSTSGYDAPRILRRADASDPISALAADRARLAEEPLF